jgi:hypothetical protein
VCSVKLENMSVVGQPQGNDSAESVN